MAYFEKYLTRVDVEKFMAIPSDFVPYMPHHGGGYTMPLAVHDVPGNVWERFGYYIRRGADHPKPVFQGDWRGYVHAKALTPGDRIIFRVEGNAANGAPRYRIAAQKRIRLFGSFYWTDEF